MENTMPVGEWISFRLRRLFQEDGEWLAQCVRVGGSGYLSDSVEDRIYSDVFGSSQAERLFFGLFAQMDWDKWATDLLVAYPLADDGEVAE